MTQGASSAAVALARAQAYVDLRRWQQALAVLSPLVASEPDNVRAWCLVAQCRLGLEDIRGTLAACDAALRVAPDDEHPHRLRSIALSEADRHGEAIRAADEAVRAAPDLWITHMQRANAGLAAGGADPATQAAARTAVELAPHEPGAYVTLGRVHYAVGNNGAAAAAYRDALALDPTNWAAQNNLAVVAIKRRRLMSAGRHLMGSLRSDPNSATSASNLRLVIRGWALLINLVCVIGCIVVLNVTADRTVTTARPSPSASVPADHDTTLSLGTDTITLPAVDEGDVDALTDGYPDVRSEAPTGRPTALVVSAATALALVLLCLAGLRRSIGRVVWQVVRRAVREQPMTGVVIAASLMSVAALVTGAATGMPAARPLAGVALAISFIASICVRFSNRRRPKRRPAYR